MTALFFFGPLSRVMGRAASPIARGFAACLASYAYNQYRGELAAITKIGITLALAALTATTVSWIAVLRQRGQTARVVRPSVIGGR
jgi:hypothetical protein